MIKRINRFLLLIIFFLGIFINERYYVVHADSYNGSCGDSASYYYDTVTGVLTISGNGSIDYNGGYPWNNYKESITAVIIEDGITNIPEDAFNGCWRLCSVEIPNSVTRIGNRAFYGCYQGNWGSITIPYSVISIGDYVFDFCTCLTSIIVDQNNSVYDSRLNCNAIIETTTNTLLYGCMNTLIPDSITSIYNNAFSQHTNLTSINIPSSVTTIGDQAFYGCDSLSTLEIPNSVISIGHSAFYSCDSLSSLYIPESVISIGESTFSACKNLESIAVSPNNKVYDSRNNCNAIIESSTDTLICGCNNTIIPDDIIIIGSDSFSSLEYLLEIKIPNNITCIEDRAFLYCLNLHSVNIPESVTTIGDSAFCGCGLLNSLEIPNSVTNIGGGAFENVKELVISCNNTIIDNEHKYGADTIVVTHTIIEGETVAPTCTTEGYIIGVCKTCGQTEAKQFLSPLGHKPLSPVEENRSEPTITEDGHYDSVVYCERCNEELSRETILIPKIIPEKYIVLESSEGNKYYCKEPGFDSYEDGTVFIESTGKYYYYLTGWKLLNGNWYYFYPYMYTDGIMDVNGKHYYFDNSGVMCIGWISETNTSGEKVWYYAQPNGELVTGWQRINNTWYYFYADNFVMFSNGIGVTNGKAYYFDSNGAMRTGWICETSTNGEKMWYYAQSSGELVTGWKKLNDKWYYFSPESYEMFLNSIREINGKQYYFDRDGIMQNGWFASDGMIYYADSSGVLQKGWKYLDSKWYFFDQNDYYMHKNGITIINDKGYYFDNNGVMKTGWIKKTTGVDNFIRTGWCYAQSNGELLQGWQIIDNKKYYFVRGQFDYLANMDTIDNIDNKLYLFNADCSLVTSKGWVKRNGEWYYCNSDGTVVTGWTSIDGKWYYCNSRGVMLTGYNYIDGVLYSFTNSGEYVGKVTGVGWKTNTTDSGDDELYYILPDGKLATGWQSIDGERYYFDLDYHYAYKGGHLIDDKLYLFNDNASLSSKTGWIKVNGEWYYRYPNGDVATGAKSIGGKNYYFDSYGIMITNTIIGSSDNNIVYFVGADGAVDSKEGWKKITYNYGYAYGSQDSWYYVGADGVCKTGWQKINNQWYFFYPYDYGPGTITGEMAAGTIIYSDDNKLYYVNADGSLISKEGWQKITYKYHDDVWYEWYYVDKDGVCKTGWQKIDGAWYYFGNEMFRNGVYCIDNQVQRFDVNGVWVGTVN